MTTLIFGAVAHRKRRSFRSHTIVPCSTRATRQTAPQVSLCPRCTVLFKYPGDPGDGDEFDGEGDPTDGRGWPQVWSRGAERRGVGVGAAAARPSSGSTLLAVIVAVRVRVALVLGQRLPRPRFGPPEAFTAHDLPQLQFAVGLATILVLARDGEYAPRRRLSRIDDALGLAKALRRRLRRRPRARLRQHRVWHRLHLLLSPRPPAQPPRRSCCSWSSRAFRCGPGSRASSVRGDGMRRLLVAGTGASAAAFRALPCHAALVWLPVVGSIAVLDEAPEADRVGGLPRSHRVLGGIPHLPAALHATGADEVVVALDHDEHARFPALLAALHAASVPFRPMPGASLRPATARCKRLGARSASYRGLVAHGPPTARAKLFVKRLCDVIFPASFALLVLSPFLLAVALASVRMESAGSAPCTAQERVGRHGRRFRMLKFRTMFLDADRPDRCRPPHAQRLHRALFKIPTTRA